jgi:biotin synthase
MAGANSIFAGDKLLTTPNPTFEEDNAMFSLLGLDAMEAFKNLKAKAQSIKPEIEPVEL